MSSLHPNAAWLGLSLLLATLPATQARADVHDRVPYAVELDANGIKLAGSYRLLIGGGVQWFRIPPEAWADRLDRFKACGFNSVDVYIPWNVVEPEEGRFVFDTPDLRRFLDMCWDRGLYVQLRPGPYITNELDGGGLPAWLLTRTTKRSRDADGLVNLRTDDPDYLAAVGRYLGALNQVLRPYLASNGGPIVLYGIENEYNWFGVFHEIEKLFWENGRSERPPLARVPTRSALAALRDLVRADGIDVPLTTCPGDGRVSGMGDVQGVMPAPNVYLMSSNRPPEQVGFELLEDMHDPTKHQGAYTDFPSAITETERSPQYFRRLLLGGFDGAFAFNAVGMIQEGYRNTVVPTGRELGDFFDFSLQGLRTAFLRPKTGYFHNVIDYGGPISASGGMRESFRRFRRDALFFSSAQTAWGGAGHALRGGTLAGASPALRVDDLELGVPQGQDKVHYWLEGQGGERFLGIHNSTGSPRRVGSGEIELAGQQIPRFSSFEIPAEDGVDKSYTQILTTQLPLAPDVRLGYSTSELLTRRSWNGDRLAVFYGTEGGEGELSLEAAGLLQVEHLDQGLRAVETGARLTVTYRHSADYQHLVVRAPGGEILRIILTTREAAGRFWFLRGPGGEHIVLAGPDYLRPGTAWGAHDVEVLIEGGSRPIPLLVMTPRAADLASASPSTTWDPSTLAAVYPPLAAPALPAVPTLVDTGLGASDAAEADPSFDDSAWQQWTGDPQPLETLGIYSGHAWYRAEVNLPGLAPWNRGRLFVKGASDIVGVYVNGHYVSTVCPLGTEIDSHGGSSYRFTDLKRHLRVGRNVIAFRVEVWGHGAFHWPRGNLVATQARMPALGYDSLKGLVGEATLAGVKLETWSVRPELGGERAGFGGPGFSDSAWLPSQVPLALGKGEVRWHRARFRTADLPDPALINAPVVCEIVGRDCKATLFLNGRLIGRWLSDDTWLARGAWGRATRSMWIAVPADHFPIPRELLVPGGENVLSVAFEDASGPAGPGGRVDSLSLRLNAEGPRTWSRAPITHRRARLRVVWR